MPSISWTLASCDGTEIVYAWFKDGEGSISCRYSDTIICQPPSPCFNNSECDIDSYCSKPEGNCEGGGICAPRPDVCPLYIAPVCGCDGITYSNDCAAAAAGVSINYRGECITLKPDLIISSLTAPATACAGQTITVCVTTKNQGAGTAGPSTKKFYFSTNCAYDAGDTYLGQGSVPSLDPGESDLECFTVTIPSDKATGTYYIIAKADADGIVAEQNENNNTKCKSIKIGPDLTVLSIVTNPTSPLAGQNVTVTVKVKSTCAACFRVDIYKHRDTAPPTGLAGDAYCEICLEAGETGTCVKTFNYAVEGTYKIWAQVDTFNAVAETNETNNTKSKSITVKPLNPDLIVSSLAAPSKGGAGKTITVSDTTKNQGLGNAVASTTKFYLSTNSTFDAGDTYLGQRPVDPLPPGASDPGSTDVTIPSDWPTGKSYIIAKADDPSTNVETNENNNTRSRLITIGPDLIVLSIVTNPASPLAGQNVTVTVTVKNQGGGAAGAFRVDIYKHRDTAPTVGLAGDEYCSITSLAAGATTTCVKTVSYAVAGTYKMWSQVDTFSAVAETNETNNTKYKTLIVKP
jgi:subtilase family serine protease